MNMKMRLMTIWIIGLAAALAHAHHRRILHRDVKPANILLAQGSEPGSDHAYLTDFGLTKQATYAGSDPRATKSGQLLGTIGYIAPEQIQGLPIDARVVVSGRWVAVTAHAGATVELVGCSDCPPPQ